ncbi:MAG TPA: hypothetical protein VM142_14950 [Acidimicrobiales bacterium]|nr:hypothetical protein [Acidimicrobiales bacterium]
MEPDSVADDDVIPAIVEPSCEEDGWAGDAPAPPVTDHFLDGYVPI